MGCSRRFLWAAVWAALNLHCAGGAALNPRSFERPGLAEIRLQSVAVLAVVTPAVKLGGARLEAAKPFPPPRLQAPLSDGRPLDGESASALVTALQRTLKSRGFEVSAAPAEGPSLSAALASVTTDAVLVVRAVPLEGLVVLQDDAATQVLDPGAGADGFAGLPVGDSTGRAVPGRLFLGQAFLFDRATGVRLWSRQLPGMPSDRALRSGVALLDYGVWGPSAAALDAPTLAQRAGQAFASKLLEGSPAPSVGSELGRVELGRVDAEAEARREAFFDRSHLLVEVGTGWTFEQVESATSLDDSALPGLSTGDLAPVGAWSAAQLRLTWMTAGGLTFGASAVLGLLPDAQLQRRVFRGTDTEAGDDVLGVQRLEGGGVLGGGLGVGRIFTLGEAILIHPYGGLFGEQWAYEATPGFLDPEDQIRLGLELRLDALWMPTRTPLYARVGLHGRGGLETSNTAGFFGGGLSLGVGVLF